MASISIPMSDEDLQQLQTLAARLQVRLEDLARAQLRDLFGQEDAELQRLCQEVITKNAELYRRLAN